jgi:undecaprenyl diphosphate synthase
VKKKLKNNSQLQINLALNYGSKKELLNAFKNLKKKKKINEHNLTSNLYTKKFLIQILLIRTGNTKD